MVREVFLEAEATYGFPAALLTDNGCVYTTWHRGGPNVMQTELLSLGIDYRHSRPYHPQTCGKVERFHQTMKGSSPSSRELARSASSRTRSIGSSRTTTRSGPTGPVGARPLEPRSMPGRRRDPRDRSSPWEPECASDETGSTRTGR